MKPRGDCDYEVIMWLESFGIITQKTIATDAVAAISNTVDPLKEKYGAEIGLIVMAVKRGSWVNNG